ncbi:HEAT repeat domain-containing protein [Haloprofundus sp. MHR1]|uniref:HEAT repeat domain-containing protein n=1 Tax=Haloprofundus sp. MHR1 TaxID=2572921 RepID=UPI0010BF6212|nr:HEAT repeat domain-containing protein [Haloprofundus sp. MHR1]QCJ47877.1 HEAT repeat domain-containing protein [Haloprofundus sp. MHR1]
MTDGDDETPTEAPDEESATDASSEITPESLDERLDTAEEKLDAAETEADLDEAEETLDIIAADLEAAELPEPDDEDEESPREELESRLSDLRDDLESQRGPYAEEVVENVEESKTKTEDTRWTDRGEGEVADAVESFLDTVAEIFEEDDESDAVVDAAVSTGDESDLVSALDAVAKTVESASLDPDEDEETIASLLEATETLQSDLEDAQEWDDLETREQLEAEGFYDVLGHYKDYPPEWSALKEHEKRGNVEMVLLALDSLQSDFMEEHCLEAITRMNDARAFDAMHQRAQKRDKPSIRALGKMGSGALDAVETLVDYVDTDKDPALQKVTFKALGEIGSEEATQPLADKLVMDNDHVRPHAARALGLIGDTRAVDPLTDTLEDDASPNVRASAAWALRQIGTEKALKAVAKHTDDDSFIVQHEVDQAKQSLDTTAPTA